MYKILYNPLQIEVHRQPYLQGGDKNGKEKKKGHEEKGHKEKKVEEKKEKEEIEIQK